MTDIIYVFRENGTTLCTSHVGDPAWDTPENRRRTFDFITRHAEAERERPRALLIQDLAAETRRADSVEAELRETAGELEKADKAMQFHVRAYDLEQARLRKATALLERVDNALEEEGPWLVLQAHIRAFLASRTPSPPIVMCTDRDPYAEHARAEAAESQLAFAKSQRDDNENAMDRRGTRDVVEKAIDISKADKRRTWAEAVACTAELPVSVMASSKGPSRELRAALAAAQESLHHEREGHEVTEEARLLACREATRAEAQLEAVRRHYALKRVLEARLDIGAATAPLRTRQEVDAEIVGVVRDRNVPGGYGFSSSQLDTLRRLCSEPTADEPVLGREFYEPEACSCEESEGLKRELRGCQASLASRTEETKDACQKLMDIRTEYDLWNADRKSASATMGAIGSILRGD